jgi:acetoin utilization deacetylase AcuC-like enzyme
LAAYSPDIKETFTKGEAMTMIPDFVYFFPIGHEHHATPQHPERPERIEVIKRRMYERGWWDQYRNLPPIELDVMVLEAIHSPKYLQRLHNACERGEWFDQDTYLVPESWEIATGTAGGATSIAREVWTGRAKTGFAICRPPGHHATSRQAMGFCLINNIAVAAEDLILNYQANRIAIIDIDLHHGNGTQDIFWERGDVFYISTHQWPLYPGTGKVGETGAGDGRMRTANLPLPPGTGDEGFLVSMDELVLPLLDEFKPEICLVSTGFDPHWKDPLGHLQMSSAGYGQCVQRIKKWADNNCAGKIALFLEGGYNLDAMAACAEASISALIDAEYTDLIGQSPYAPTDRWRQVLTQAKEIWQIAP